MPLRYNEEAMSKSINLPSQRLIVECAVFIVRYRPSPEDHLLKAFQVLDSEAKGYLLQEEMTKFMTEEGMKLWVNVFDSYIIL